MGSTEKPWLTEPKSASWKRRINGYELYCAIVRNPHMGHLCGYVGIGAEHPLYDNDDYMDSPLVNLEVHGGLTFASSSSRLKLLSQAMPVGSWCFGFDCAHYGDLVPSMENHGRDYEQYRDFKYVTEQVNSLAEQLANYKLDREVSDGKN